MSEASCSSSFLVTKHSWKGKYRRVLTLSPDSFSTYNPSSMEVTNSWKLQDIINLTIPNSNSGGDSLLEFQLHFTKKGSKKTDSMRFSSEHRPFIVTEGLRLLQQNSNNEACKASTKCYFAYKYHWSDQRISTCLRVGNHSLDQLDPNSKTTWASYNFKDISAIYQVQDYPGGFVLQTLPYKRLHLFASESRSEILKHLAENASSFVGINLSPPKNMMAFATFLEHKFGIYSTADVHITSISEFLVYKQSSRHRDPVRRSLCLTETCLLERDPATYSIVSLRPLSQVSALVRHAEHPQLVSFQYACGQVRSYTSTDRDSLIASFLDGVRGSGNRDVHVRMSMIERGKRLAPLNVNVDEEVESSHLKFLVQPPPSWTFQEAVSRFNANVNYSGLVHAVTQEHLFAENKEKLIHGGLSALISRDLPSDDTEGLEQQFHALRRLVASKAGFAGFTSLQGFREKIGVKVAKALKLGHDGISHAAIDMVCALMEPMHEDYDLKQEQLNKSSLLSSERFLDGLLDMWTTHVMRGTGALVVAAMLDLLTFALCAPYSETTEGKQFDILLEKVAERGRTLYRLFQCPSHTIVKGAGLLMKAIIEEGSPETGRKMQLLALAEGAVPIHLVTALFTKSSENRLLMQKQLSRHLIGLWTCDNECATQLLERIIPAGLLNYLVSDATTPTSDKDRLHVRDNLSLAVTDAERANKANVILQVAGKGLKSAKETASKTAEYVAEHTSHYTEEARKLAEKQMELALQHWRTRMSKEWSNQANSQIKEDNQLQGPQTSGPSVKEVREVKPKERPIVLRKRREHIKSNVNWPLFYYQFEQDHSKPDLIWNLKTRQELRDSLETEITTFLQDRELAGNALISWNYQEFQVNYQSLADEIKIGDYFLRLLLEEDMADHDRPISKSREFFNDLYHRFLLTPKSEMKCLCLQAMTIVYGRHYEDIGAFHDTKYIVAMLDRTLDRVERDRLLLFLNKLILHRDNSAALIQANGVRILTDLLPLAHLHTSRAILANQSMAIEASPDSTKEMQEKEWYYGNADKERNGPVSFAELADLFDDKTVHARTKVWAQGLEGWRLLQQVPQLKWKMLAKGQPVMNESELATLILGMMIQMCRYYPSKDADGAVIRPLPKIKQGLSDPTYLPHLVQLLLTFDPVLVEKVSLLLHLVLEDNARLPTLYLTGCFFFILMYTGSNLLPIGQFLHLTHNRQAYRSEDNEGSEIRRQSILTQLLPEAMVAYLENHGFEKFAQIFLGEYDTPEAIWNGEMRQFLVQKLACHLADFTPRLKSNVKALYQYCPIPMISYPPLENELFCDIYYLRNLCNTDRFPDWPILNPLRLLKEVLTSWRAEVEKKPSSMTAVDAMRILGLPGGPVELTQDEAKIRKAYFKMAQKYHPDKNPKGRDMFEKVNSAYEFLCSRAAKSSDQPDPGNIVLVLRAQSILFSRYSQELHPYKYAGYPMLIKTIQMETDDDKLFSKSAPLLAAASECAFYTVKCSALNAEEMRRENGLEVLYQAFERCVSVLSKSSKPDDVAVQVCIHVTRFYSVASQFQLCRDRMVEMPELVKNVCRIFYYKHLTALCAVAAECVSSLAVDAILQMHLLQAGVLWHLLIFLFDYDYTLEEGGVEAQEDNSQQYVANKLAKLAVQACARLAGLMVDEELATPKNPVIEESLKAMITPYVVQKMGQNKVEEVLKLLNSNVESPYLIWDNGTRAELIEFLDSERTSSVRRGTCDPSFGSEHSFTAHKDELVVGDIFVRIYNQQPMFQLEEPKRFAVDLLEFLNGETQYLYSLMSLSQTQGDKDPPSERLVSSEMALEALANVIKHNRGVDIQCIGHFKLLFSLLRLERCPKIQEMALYCLSNVTGSSECLDDMAASQVLVNVLQVIYTLSDHRSVALDLMHALVGDTRLVKECLAFSGVVCLVYLFCCAQDSQVREKSAEVLCKMSSDKLMGPKARIAVAKFLPEIFLDAMKKSVEACLQMFESCHENPELIWNDETRKRLTLISKRLAEAHVAHLKTRPDVAWSPPQADLDAAQNFVAQNELVVSGIYVRLFIANPGWVLRKPREFLSDLLENALQIMKSVHPDLQTLETITTALVKLLEAQPSLADMVPATGYISRLLTSIASLDNDFQKPGVLIINELSRSSVCVEALAKCDTVAPLKRAMNLRSDLVFPTIETFSNLFQGHHDSLVKQALQCELIKDLLALLDSPLRDQTSPSGTKALIVKSLKAMQCSLLHGEEVSSQLKSNPVWQQYEQQKHDLFLTERTTAGYLTAGPGVAGYLTSTSMRKTVPNVPPPMDNNGGNNLESNMKNNPLL